MLEPFEQLMVLVADGFMETLVWLGRIALGVTTAFTTTFAACLKPLGHVGEVPVTVFFVAPLVQVSA